MQFKSLFASSILAIAAVSAQGTTGALGDADVVSNNPIGTTYAANFNGSVSGKMDFTANTNGTGVAVTVTLRGFKGEKGPFSYHVHDQPVPASGSCNATLAHLDPYQRGQTTPCDKTQPETCEVGDLAGKHNTIPDTNGDLVEFHDSYIDLYISTKSGLGSFVGNRSIVIHKAGGGRLICANIQLASNAPITPSGPAVKTQQQQSAAFTFGVSSVLSLGIVLAAVVTVF